MPTVGKETSITFEKYFNGHWTQKLTWLKLVTLYKFYFLMQQGYYFKSQVLNTTFYITILLHAQEAFILRLCLNFLTYKIQFSVNKVTGILRNKVLSSHIIPALNVSEICKACKKPVCCRIRSKAYIKRTPSPCWFLSTPY